jgi:taurine dioxygenase
VTQALARTDFTVRRLGGTFGAEITGLDLSAQLDETTVDALRRTFLEHCVLVFPGQGHLTPAQQAAFASRWGELQLMPEGSPVLGGQREVFVLDFEGRRPPTDVWHSDLTLTVRPPMATVLLGRVIPIGGDTLFASQYLAYEAFSDGMKAMLEGLRAVHTGKYWAKNGTTFEEDELPRSAHPVVRTHPETGRRALYVNSAYTSHFEGMTVEESRPLLDWLCSHSVQPNFTFRHRWSEGDLLMWDNRCLQHFAVADYGSARRVMHRVVILGDEPR